MDKGLERFAVSSTLLGVAVADGCEAIMTSNKRDIDGRRKRLASAAAEKAAALMTEEYLAERSNRGSRGKFERVLAKVPDVPASPADAI